MKEKSTLSIGLRLFGPGLLLLAFVVVAEGYTIIMKGGRRVEIPAQFSVTQTTVTYDAGPQIQVTLQTAAIDIPATERANDEAPGSLLARIGKQLVEPSSQTVNVSAKARRSITNRELETYAQVRRESETAYERRRKELGLPSVAESRARAAADAQLIRQELDEKRSAEKEAESYWRSRASELRSQIAGVDAEMNFLRSRLDEVSVASANTSYTVVSSIFPFGPVGRIGSFARSNMNPLLGNPLGVPVGAPFGVPFGVVPGAFRRPGVFVAPGSHPGGRRGFAIGNTRGRFPVNSGRGFFGRSFAVAPPILPFSDVTSFSSPLGFYDSNYDSSAVMARLDELIGAKAALNARWRELEDEARRAGVPPGWLRP